MGAVSSVVHAVGKVVKPAVKAAANVVTAGAYNHMQNKAKDQARKAQAQAARQQAQAEEQQSQNANMANKKHANVGDTVVDDTPEGMSETVLASEAAQDDRFKLQKKQLIGG